jgi:dCMP deaminase
MIIGLTGPNASGKGEAALYIKSKGFIYYSLSNILREESIKLGIEPLRKNLIKLGNELRRKRGRSFLALCAMKEIKKNKNYVIDSIRNPAEVQAFRRMSNFILIGINAPVEMRFKRSLERKRKGDAETLEEFIKKEKEENRNSSENQQLKKCLRMADVIVANDSTIEEFRRKIDEAIKKNKKT